MFAVHICIGAQIWSHVSWLASFSHSFWVRGLVCLLIWTTKSDRGFNRSNSLSWRWLRSQGLMAVGYGSTDYLFHSRGWLIRSTYQVCLWHVLESRTWVDTKDLCLTGTSHNSSFIFPMRWLTQIVFQLSVRQTLLRSLKLMRSLLSEIKVAGLRLLHLLHVVIVLDLVSVILIILTRSLLLLARS